MLYDAIESLPQKDRAILRMSFVEGLRNADIAKRLDIAEITVKKHKARIMAMLRDKLQLPPPYATVLIIKLLHTHPSDIANILGQ